MTLLDLPDESLVAIFTALADPKACRQELPLVCSRFCNVLQQPNAVWQVLDLPPYGMRPGIVNALSLNRARISSTFCTRRTWRSASACWETAPSSACCTPRWSAGCGRGPLP